jgi:hypothetical protein
MLRVERFARRALLAASAAYIRGERRDALPYGYLIAKGSVFLKEAVMITVKKIIIMMVLLATMAAPVYACCYGNTGVYFRAPIVVSSCCSPHHEVWVPGHWYNGYWIQGHYGYEHGYYRHAYWHGHRHWDGHHHHYRHYHHWRRY